MCPSNRADARLGKSEMQHLSLTDQFGHRLRHFLNRDIRVNPVLIVQINVICPQSFERTFCRPADRFRPGIQSCHSAVVHAPSKFRRQNDLISDRLKRLADQLLILSRRVCLRGIKEGLPHLRGSSEKPDALFLFRKRRITL